jgi:hypothetical protein
VRIAALFFLGSALFAQDAQLERARKVNLDRASNLPNFVADEIAKRYKSPHTNPPKWQLVDTIESEIAVRGDAFTRQHTTVNGKPWIKDGLPDGAGWSVRFGYEIKPLFSPECHTSIESAGREERLGKPALAYQFHVGSDNCFGTFSIKNGFLGPLKVYTPARFGRFLIDEAGNLIYFEIEANGFPKGWAGGHSKETEAWDYVRIGDASYLLPVSTEITNDLTRDGAWRVTVEYKNHRHFEASTDVTFK